MLIGKNEINDEKVLKFLLNYITLRLDIINISKNENSIEIIENSDLNSTVSFPKWFKRGNNQGTVVTSSNLSLDLKIKTLADGELRIVLKSMDVRDKNKERFPIYLDLNQFKINEEKILTKHNTVSFSSPKKFSKKVNKDEIVNIHLEWMPFNKNCEYKNPTKPLMQKINKLNDELEFFKSNDNGLSGSYELKSYIDELSNLKSEFEDYKNKIQPQLDSYHFLLEGLYINHELKPRGYIGLLHKVYNELLVFIDNVCKKHGLEWWLDYGNLLGAVRHGGFIPWDDDVDIGMMRTDYQKLYDVLSDEIKQRNLEDIVTLHFRNRVINYRRASSFLQIFFYSNSQDGERKRLLANIDVFPYDYINSYNKKEINEVYYNAKMKYYNNLIEQKDKDESFKIMYNDLNLNLEKTDLIIPGIEGACGMDNVYPLVIFDTDKIFPLKTIKYSDNMFPCPNDAHHYLKKIYGDYLSLPEVVRSHKRSKKFKYSQNSQEIYSVLLKTFEEINSDF